MELRTLILEISYVVIGLFFFMNAVQAFRTCTDKKVGTALFWSIFGFIFAFGAMVPPIVTGFLLILVAVLTFTKQVAIGKFKPVDSAKREERAKTNGWKVFLPSLFLAFVAVGVGFLTNLGGQAGIALGSLTAFILGLILFRPKPTEIYESTSQLTQTMGATIFLPQLLSSLGAMFTLAKVGNLISSGVVAVIPENNRLLGVIAYVLGMVIFTMIMGNAFAAFTVITAGIGVPFVFALGGNPILIGTMAMTAGYCGTLMTPMAANFNALPAALLEMKNQNGVIKAQLPIALTMIVVHIIAMYTLGF